MLTGLTPSEDSLEYQLDPELELELELELTELYWCELDPELELELNWCEHYSFVCCCCATSAVQGTVVAHP